MHFSRPFLYILIESQFELKQLKIYQILIFCLIYSKNMATDMDKKLLDILKQGYLNEI